MKFLNIIFCLSISYNVFSQNINNGLIAHFPFDALPLNDVSGNNNNAVGTAIDSLECGVEGKALFFDGLRSEVIFTGAPIFDNFKSADFSLSFYFRPGIIASSNTFDIMSKRANCGTDSSFAIRYTPLNNQLSVELFENARTSAVILQQLDNGRCWQHIVVTRAYNKLSLYVNGRLVKTALSNKRVVLNNSAPFSIARSPCLAVSDRKFAGTIDELRLYDRAITPLEVEALYLKPEQIVNADTIIYLGSSVLMNIGRVCTGNTQITWSGSGGGISNPQVDTPTITPTVAGNLRYFVTMKGKRCSSTDTFSVKVIDPSTLDCKKVYLPNAFTPNTNSLNDRFYISNNQVIDLVSFEIFDAWGTRVFNTTDRSEAWDGTMNGRDLNPGVYAWRVRYQCKGEELSAMGSVTLMR